uniref:DUF429 domain-containing protein n=1 Tax=Fervidicoccus fontis TaxID=683846 RepID=A0A7J3ZKU5_9CREN
MRVAGVDLSASKSKPSYCCLLNSEEACILELSSIDEIVKAIVEFRPQVAAIDAPLSLPEGNKPFRTFEYEAIREGARLLPLTLKGMRELAAMGRMLAAKLEAEKLDVIETHPASAALFLGRRNTVELARQATGLTLRKDEADAITCCIVAMLFIAGKCRVYGGNPRFVLPEKHASRVASSRSCIKRVLRCNYR